jgi:hypothetical protein
MISVLIPIYNYSVVNLINTLHKQLIIQKIPFEIITIDDASTSFVEENNEIKKLKEVSFEQLQKNIGRSKIRNLLAQKATYNWLLFLDCDVIPKSENFIANYINNIQSNQANLYFGGILNQTNKPNSKKMLRWVYGKKREDIYYLERQKSPFSYFLGSNFLIEKVVFETAKFNENIVDYGYEDLLFINTLKKKGNTIVHTNNPVYHNGIDESVVFLAKTKEALENLYDLKTKNILKFEQVKLLKAVEKVKVYGFESFLSNIYKIFNNVLEYNLTSRYPSLFIFDFYKLTYFCYLEKNKSI